MEELSYVVGMTEIMHFDNPLECFCPLLEQASIKERLSPSCTLCPKIQNLFFDRVWTWPNGHVSLLSWILFCSCQKKHEMDGCIWNSVWSCRMTTSRCDLVLEFKFTSCQAFVLELMKSCITQHQCWPLWWTSSHLTFVLKHQAWRRTMHVMECLRGAVALLRLLHFKLYRLYNSQLFPFSPTLFGDHKV